ncbi:MAG: dihydrolipoyl dehydrogenase [Chloroflexia bacterium]|nr:dihydrolipoyl dehydrogenase [Chloroflexia bacterium]
MSEHFDLAIIGAGPGGYVAAIRAAQLGARVALLEKERVGGVCLNHGCIPTKALLWGAEVLHLAREGEQYGILGSESARPDWARMQDRKAEIVESLVSGVEKLLQSHNVQVMAGRAALLDPQTLQFGPDDGGESLTLQADRLILATGSLPIPLPVPGADLPGVLNSRQALQLEQIPHRLVVVGAGVIGIELGVLFSLLGSEVTVVEMLPRILPAVEGDLAKRFGPSLRRLGLTVRTNSRVEEIVQGEDGALGVVMTGRKGEETIWGERVLVAIGRRPCDGGLELERLGIDREGRAIAVNGYLETTVEGVYAIGDCTGGSLLAHRASYHGEVAVENAMGHRRQVDERALPYVVYTMPEIAGVGLTSEQAQEMERPFELATFPLRANGRALTRGESDGLVRLLYDPDEGTILGVHLLAPHASELLAEATLAVQARLKVGQLADTMHAHPTLSEALMEAAKAAAYGEAIHFRTLRR